ncbi:MAG: hypothetical protein JST83_18055 [Bacteroidetes bacterium]|nr:hypothetical protein [Bacteroidota bacterium]
MFDTVRIYGHNSYPAFAKVNFVDYFSGIFPEYGESLPEDERISSHKIYKSLSNLKITASANHFSIENSLCKYYHGNNFTTLTYDDLQSAIEKLKRELGSKLPLDHAKVTLFDFGTNISLDKPAVQYLNLLVDSPGYDTYPYRPSGKYFSKQRRQLLFYDKMATNEYPPPAFWDKNLLRYEIQYLDKLDKQFGKYLYVKDLKRKGFFNQLLSQWRKEYFKVTKQPYPYIDYSQATNADDLIRLHNIQTHLRQKLHLGDLHAQALDEINVLAKAGHFKYAIEKRRWRKKVNEYYSKGFTPSVFEKELNAKIRDAYAYYKA